MSIKIKVVIFSLILGGVFFGYKFSWQGGDLSLLAIVDSRLELINISPARGMVNIYEIKDVDLWIPNGMGWYPASRLGLVVKKDKELVKRVAFYNFGFWPEQVVLDGGWNNNKFLWSVLGPLGLVRFRLLEGEWLWKSEVLKMANISEAMTRDMADSRVLNSDVKINVVNASGKNGFGNMVADRLDWWGLTVTSVQTGDIEPACQIYFDRGDIKNNYINKLATILGCERINRDGVVELVLGTNLEEMVKYSQTYVRAF